MEFKNGYNLIYEKATADGKALFASKAGIPTEDDEAIDTGLTKEEIAATKLFYEADGTIKASMTGLPSADALSVELTINGEPVIGPEGPGPGPVPPTPTGLTAFGREPGYDVPTIVVDPTAMTTDELNAFYNDCGSMVVFIGREDAGAPYIFVDKEELKGILIMTATPIPGQPNAAIYFPEPIEGFADAG